MARERNGTAHSQRDEVVFDNDIHDLYMFERPVMLPSQAYLILQPIDIYLFYLLLL